MTVLLSIVTFARNDNYMGNSNWRLETAINFAAAVLEKLHRLKDVEVLIVDWGSEVPLHSVLKLNDHAKRISRFILVQNPVIKEINVDSEFPAVIALNAGIRRAYGDYIIDAPADILLTEKFFNKIFEMIQGNTHIGNLIDRTLFFFSRKDIPIGIVNQNLSMIDLAKYIEEHDKVLNITPLHPYYLCPAGALMIHRDIFRESRGFDERLIHWGWADVDYCLRMRLRHSVADMSTDKDLYVYHLDHYSSGFVRTKISPSLISPFIVNNEDWGLGNYVLEEFPPNDSLCMVNDMSKVAPKSDKYFMWKNLLNAAKFLLKNRSIENLKFGFNHMLLIISQYPDNSCAKRMYLLIRSVKLFLWPRPKKVA